MEYVNLVTLEVNGQSIDDFQSVTEKEVELRKEVRLVNKSGVVKIRPRYGVSVDYVIPKSGAEYDFGQVEDGTLTIDLENGVRKQYSGVYTLKVGEAKYGEDKEVVRTIEFAAMKRS